MKIQNISSNKNIDCHPKKTRKNLAFNANIYAVTKATCHDGNLCELAFFKMFKKFFNVAIKSEKIDPENGIGAITKTHPDGRTEFALLDSKTRLYKQLEAQDLITKEGPTDSEKIIEQVINDPETVKLPFAVKEEEICPAIDLELARLTSQN